MPTPRPGAIPRTPGSCPAGSSLFSYVSLFTRSGAAEIGVVLRRGAVVGRLVAVPAQEARAVAFTRSGAKEIGVVFELRRGAVVRRRCRGASEAGACGGRTGHRICLRDQARRTAP